jgi:phosphatidylserine/phosphatidylglycerophosphate/cardiolipin synthase-like enzyme
VIAAPASQAPVAYAEGAAAVFRTLLDVIKSARRSLVVQMYLFAGNDELSFIQPQHGAFPYAQRMADALIAQRQRGVDVVVVVDSQTPDDVRRGNARGPLTRHRLRAAGVVVLNACLWRTRFNRARRFPPAARFHEPDVHGGVDVDAFVARQQRWQALHNVEDHRKNIVVDGGRCAVVTSHNFIDVASTWHENAFVLFGAPVRAVRDLVHAAVVDALALPQPLDAAGRADVDAVLADRDDVDDDDDDDVDVDPGNDNDVDDVDDDGAGAGALGGDVNARAPRRVVPVEVLDTLAIKPRLLAAIAATPAGGTIRAASTYFADVALFDAFVDAARRGVRVQILIDTCTALPLKPLYAWIVRTFANLRVLRRAVDVDVDAFDLRVHASGARDMMHVKTALFAAEGRQVLVGGHANYTPNSFDGAWLETNVMVEHPEAAAIFAACFDARFARARAVRTFGRRARLEMALAMPLLRLFAWLGVSP